MTNLRYECEEIFKLVGTQMTKATPKAHCIIRNVKHLVCEEGEHIEHLLAQEKLQILPDQNTTFICVTLEKQDVESKSMI